MLQFVFVTGILTVVGSRVASLVVLEFCLRAVSGWVTAGPVRNQPPDKKYMPDTLMCRLICLLLLLLQFEFVAGVVTHDFFSLIICFESSISSVHMLLYSSGVQELCAAAVSSEPVLSGMRPELQFALSP